MGIQRAGMGRAYCSHNLVFKFWFFCKKTLKYTLSMSLMLFSMYNYKFVPMCLLNYCTCAYEPTFRAINRPSPQHYNATSTTARFRTFKWCPPAFALGCQNVYMMGHLKMYGAWIRQGTTLSEPNHMQLFCSRQWCMNCNIWSLPAVFLIAYNGNFFKELQAFLKLSTRASSTQYHVVIAPLQSTFSKLCCNDLLGVPVT